MKRNDLLDFAKKLDSDKDLKKRLAADPKGVLAELGIEPATLVDAKEQSSAKELAAKTAGGNPSPLYTAGCVYIGIISPMWCGRTRINAELPSR